MCTGEGAAQTDACFSLWLDFRKWKQPQWRAHIDRPDVDPLTFTMKQIIDLLRQLRSAAPELQIIIDQALTKIDRGVIAYAGAAV